MLNKTVAKADMNLYKSLHNSNISCSGFEMPDAVFDDGECFLPTCSRSVQVKTFKLQAVKNTLLSVRKCSTMMRPVTECRAAAIGTLKPRSHWRN